MFYYDWHDTCGCWSWPKHFHPAFCFQILKISKHLSGWNFPGLIFAWRFFPPPPPSFSWVWDKVIQLMVVGVFCGFFVLVFKKRRAPWRTESYYQKEMQCFKQHKCRIREAYDELGCSVWCACFFMSSNVSGVFWWMRFFFDEPLEINWCIFTF